MSYVGTTKADRLKTCASSDDCKEVVQVSLNAFNLCDFVFQHSNINVLGGVVVEWTIDPRMAAFVKFANASDKRGPGIDIKQGGTDDKLRPFISPQSSEEAGGSPYFRWTANPSDAVTHDELPYFVNVRIMDAINTPISCKSDPTIANNHH